MGWGWGLDGVGVVEQDNLIFFFNLLQGKKRCGRPEQVN